MSTLSAKEYKCFEDIKRVRPDGSEYWAARELAPVLDYAKWENFYKVIKRAMIACENSGRSTLECFPEVRKTSPMPNGGVKDILDYELSRYACYLIVQNGDPRKEVIALGQTYFAIQTYRQEVADRFNQLDEDIIGGVVITKDGRFVKILELLPVNIYLKSPNDRQNIISSFAAYLKIAPNDLQMVARTLPADTQAYVEQMQRYAEKEDNEACREMIEDNIQEIGNGIASDAMRHRFFLVFQYEAGMRAKRNTVDSIIQRLNEEADTARRYLDVCELEVLEPQYSDNFVLKLLYEILSKKTSQRVRLPDGVFDMMTAVHGIYEE